MKSAIKFLMMLLPLTFATTFASTKAFASAGSSEMRCYLSPAPVLNNTAILIGDVIFSNADGTTKLSSVSLHHSLEVQISAAGPHSISAWIKDARSGFTIQTGPTEVIEHKDRVIKFVPVALIESSEARYYLICRAN